MEELLNTTLDRRGSGTVRMILGESEGMCTKQLGDSKWPNGTDAGTTFPSGAPPPRAGALFISAR